MTPAEIEKLQRRIGYTFEAPEHLALALTHRSYAANNNERLEFLGDGVLNFIVAEALYSKFPEAAEGQLSRLRALLVKQKTLSDIGREFSLSDFLIMGTGELKSGGFNRDSILSDAVEALVAAIYQESGFESARAVVLNWFETRLEELSLDQLMKDSKSRLQEYLQGRQHPLPVYEVIQTEGEAHAQTFTVRLTCDVLDEAITAMGNSKRVAEQNAAAQALIQLEQKS